MEGLLELITNGLDLVAFILVTPELVRYAGVTAQLTGLVMIVLFSASSSILLAIIVTIPLMELFDLDDPDSYIVFLGLWAVLAFSTKPILRRVMERAGSVLPRYAFFVGVCVFFVSRLIALSGALAKLMAHKS
jgi:hypothetical protein